MVAAATRRWRGERVIDPAVWRIALVVSIGTLTVALDTTIVNVALQTLTEKLHAPLTEVQWVVSAYLLAIAAVIPISSWLARRFGGRNVLLFSLALFTLGSVLCGLATSSTELIAYRVVQGLGGGLMLPVGQQLVANAAGPVHRGRVMGMTSAPIILAPLFGPTIGGLILDHLDWQWIFFVNVPLGLLSIALGLRFLPRGAPQEAGPFDALGFAILVVAMPAVVYGLAELGTQGSFDPVRVVVPLVVGLLLVGLFVRHALRTSHPLLDMSLYRNRVYAWAQTSATLNVTVSLGVLILWPLYFQEVRGYDLFKTGLFAGAHGIGICVVLPWAGRLADRFGGGSVALVGSAIAALFTIPFAFMDAHTPLAVVELTMFVRGIGAGAVIMPTMVAAYGALRPEQMGDGAAQLNILQRVGGALGTAVIAVILARATTALGHAPGRDQLAGAYDTTFWWVLGFASLALVPCFMLRSVEKRHRLTRTLTEVEPAAVVAP